MSEPTITVAGVTFSAKQLKNAVVTIDNRDITIHDEKEEKQVGFKYEEKEKEDE